MAALEAMEGLALDLSPYRCIYISFGSKNQTKVKPFYQDFPYFLEAINKYPLCVISIDDYPEFTNEERDVPYGIWEDKDHPRKRYTHITIPSHSMDETIHITKQLVELLDNESQVFFVNFIKYRSKIAHDARPETEAMQLVSHLGKYRDNYYEWYGFGLFHDFIIKNTPSFESVKQILYFKDNPNGTEFLKYLKNDGGTQPKAHVMLRSNLIDITPTITPEQIELLHPEFTAGKRTRKSRRRTKRTKRR